MSSENQMELLLIASEYLQAMKTQNEVLARIADALCKSKRPKKGEQVDQRIAMMMAWIGHSGETSQAKLAKHFNVDPSSIRGKKYEPVRLAIAMNKAAARASRSLQRQRGNPDG